MIVLLTSTIIIIILLLLLLLLIDPHEANILIRPHPKQRYAGQIVLLDHGLYRQLSSSFRLDYLHLWEHLLLRNESQIEYYCRKLQAGDLYSLLAAMLMMKPWHDIMVTTQEDR
jgi:aarF domain-containing kinase